MIDGADIDGMTARFWSNVDRSGPVPERNPELGPCWIWSGTRRGKGYGSIGTGVSKPSQVGAHRFSWFIETGASPGRLLVCHRCDNPPCVNPAHLFLGTVSDNARDARNKGRLPFPFNGLTHCARGHELTGDNLYYRDSKSRVSKHRQCRECVMVRAREYAASHGRLYRDGVKPPPNARHDGKPCKVCGSTEKYSSCNSCVACAARRDKEKKARRRLLRKDPDR